MAKKRKKGKKEDEEYEFVPPEFDEREFLKKELSDTRTFLFTIAYAIVFAVAAGAVSSMDEDLIAPSFLLVVAGLASLKFYYALTKVDVSSFTKKNWAGNVASFFFSFLAVWVLMLNIPFMDYADPSIDSVVVWVDDGSTVTKIEYKVVQGINTWVPDTEISVSAGSTVNITARVADTGTLVRVDIAVGSLSSAHHAMTALGDNVYEFKIDSSTLSADSPLTFYIIAEDRSGNQSVFQPERGIPVVA
jgi:hypothetical protein